MIKVKSKLNVQINARGRKTIRAFTDEDRSDGERLPGRIPRITRLMALAIQYQSMLQTGEVTDMIELARIAHVSQPRMTQIMGLNLLAPDIQAALLNLPPQRAKCLIHEKRLRPLTAMLCWSDQRKSWTAILAEIGCPDAGKG